MEGRLFMRLLHLIVGLLGVAAFLASGLYMHYGYDHLRGMDDVHRLQFRSTHIYLLLCALVNLALGLYLVPANDWRKWVQLLASAIILATPFLAAVGFYYEPWMPGLYRPYSRLAAYGSLAGMALHGVANLRWPATRKPA
jgi:hypothetical protein